MWIGFKIRDIPEEKLLITPKRFPGEELLLTELVDYNSYAVRKFFSDCKTPLDVINKVIVEIKYPLDWRGLPTDFHCLQAFKQYPTKCRVTLKNELDFWQKASETVLLRIGDCEDVCHLAAAGMQRFTLEYGLGWFVCYGFVYVNNRLLGGHAFFIFQPRPHVWKLAELTLDEPYRSYDEMPNVDLNTNTWVWRTRKGEVKYVARLIWNLDEVCVWVVRTDTALPGVDTVLKDIMVSRDLEKKYYRKNEKRKLKELANVLEKRVKGVS